MTAAQADLDFLPQEFLTEDFKATWQAATTPAERARCLLHHSKMVIGHRDLLANERLTLEALRLALLTDEPELAALCLNHRAWVEVNRGAYALALEHCEQALLLVQEHGLRVVECRILNTRALPRVWIGDELGARRDMARAVSLALHLQNDELLLGCYVNSAWINTLCERPDLSGHFHNLLEEHLYRHAPPHLLTRYLEHLHGGRAHDQLLLALQARQLGRLDAEQEAIQAGWRYLNLCAALPEQSRAAQLMTYTLATHFLRLQGDLVRAERKGEQALMHCLNNDPGLVPLAYVSLAEVRMEQGRYVEALRGFQEALRVIGPSGRYREVQNILTRMAAAYQQLGRHQAALESMHEALRQAQQALRQVTEAEDQQQLMNAVPVDETRWQEQLRQAEHQARLDPLTGLLNRRGWDAGVQQLKMQDEAQVLVAFFDIDHFKRVNDEFSHATGDEVLLITAALLRELLPPGSLLARYGGEEFTLLLHPSPEYPDELLNRCRMAVQDHDWSALLGQHALTISVGFTLGRLEDTPQLLRAADQALYQAKQNGRNQVRKCYG